MSYNPFDKSFEEIEPSDLAVLLGVSEGWHVEYKSQLIATKPLAKSISAFANHYGGWLFLGVSEAGGRASSFPGLSIDDAERAVEELRNAARACVNPAVFYRHRILPGPVEALGLPEGMAVLVVNVPPGPEPPYVHSDARIYRRIADASDPKPETDRATLDLLWERGRSRRRKLKKLVNRLPELSEAESEQPFIHLFLSADPFEVEDRKTGLSFQVFAKVASSGSLAFDNIYSHSEGYVARQIGPQTNDPFQRVLTWEHSFSGHSHISVPISFYNNVLLFSVQGYEHCERFQRYFERTFSKTSPTLLDLNIVLAAMGECAKNFRALRAAMELDGPIYAKAVVDNVWRCVPYVDTRAFADFVDSHGVPIVQNSRALVPPGTSLDSFIKLNVQEDSGLAQYVSDAVTLTTFVLSALGVPRHVLAESGGEVALLLERAQESQRRRTA